MKVKWKGGGGVIRIKGSLSGTKAFFLNLSAGSGQISLTLSYPNDIYKYFIFSYKYGKTTKTLFKIFQNRPKKIIFFGYFK